MLEIEVKPLTVSSLPLLMQMSDEADKEVQANAMREVLKTTLKDAIPDATDEEVDKIPLEHIQTLMEAIMEVNKMEDMSSAKEEMLDRVKRTQAAGNPKGK